MVSVTTFLLAVGLAMDAAAVSIASGARVPRLRLGYTLRIAFLFGLFQALMPLIGWGLGYSLHDVMESVDHWVAFAILSGLGARMIYHDLWHHGEEGEVDPEGTWGSLLALAVATSIDAAVAGIGFIVLPSVVPPIITIGVVTFVLCIAGVVLGHRFKWLAGARVDTVGGLILIALGTKILIEHLTA